MSSDSQGSSREGSVLWVFPYCLDHIGHGNIQRVLAIANYLARQGVAVDLVPHGLAVRRIRDRPAGRGLSLLRVPRTLPRILPPEQVDALLAALRTRRDRAMVEAMLLGGLRRCEVLGLRLAVSGRMLKQQNEVRLTFWMMAASLPLFLAGGLAFETIRWEAIAVAPVLVDVCLARRLNPVPFLLALACAANVGSAATLIGNPQNMLIGETLELPFLGYIREVALPVALSLAFTWAIIAWRARGRWELASGAGAADGHAPGERPPPFDRWQSAKGIAVAAVVFVLFLFAPLPREVVALVAAGLLMTSRKLHSFKMLGLVDWQLLVLFIGLFVVNYGLARTGLPQDTIRDLAATGVDIAHPVPLFAAAFVLSNIVSNVPAVMLLLPAATHGIAGPVLALASTLAGNLLIVGSIANIIVVDAAQRRDIHIGWKEHARVGVPVTLATMAIAAGWLWLRLGAGE